MSFVSFTTNKRFFHIIMPKNSIVPCHSNWVMWPIKIFRVSQGFLISTLLGYQNEFCVFRNQKTLFSPNNAKKRYCSLSFKLGHVTYQNIRLESRIPNIHFTWLSKWVLCLLQPNNAKKKYCSLSFKLGHVTYWNIWREPRILAHIFSLPIFCRKQYFVVAVIFYLLIFCR